MTHINSDAPLVGYADIKRSSCFVDKTGLGSSLTPFFGSDVDCICITRPRRFGKTVNAQMLASFLTRGLDAAPLFEGLEVSRDPAAMAHLGAHDVIYIDFSALPDERGSYRDYIDAIRAGLVDDLRAFAPEAGVEPGTGLFAALERVYDATKARFCFIMDEWDSMFFNPLFTEDDQRAFLMFLKQLLKTKPYVELAYMTGILPIAKHSTSSELNMFVGYSALEDPRYDRFFGFTQDEVRELCARHLARTPDARVGYEGLERWYDGYLTEDGERRFNPRSVVLALIDDSLRSYWTESGPYDEIYCYVRNNIAAVRDDLVRMVGRRAGARGDGELCRLVHEPYYQRRDILGHGGVRVPHVLRWVRVNPQPRAHAEVPEAARQGGHGLRCAPGPAQRGHAGRHAPRRRDDNGRDHRGGPRRGAAPALRERGRLGGACEPRLPGSPRPLRRASRGAGRQGRGRCGVHPTVFCRGVLAPLHRGAEGGRHRRAGRRADPRARLRGALRRRPARGGRVGSPSGRRHRLGPKTNDRLVEEL